MQDKVNSRSLQGFFLCLVLMLFAVPGWGAKNEVSARSCASPQRSRAKG